MPLGYLSACLYTYPIMWAVDNRTPFEAERCWNRDLEGREVWLVSIKATLNIQTDGSLALSEDPVPPSIPPVFRDKSRESSLLNDTDFPLLKTSTDVLVEGHAYAPGGKPCEATTVRLKVANIDKQARVIGDRTWQRAMGEVILTRPSPFVRMPVIYERAFGGIDQKAAPGDKNSWNTANPVGRGMVTHRDHLVGLLAPNLERMESCIRRWSDRPDPIGFGPVAGHWSPRIQLAGTYDDGWLSTRQPLLPLDFNDRFYQCAPEDQQVPGFLKGGEEVVLQNFTSAGLLRFRLPRISFALETTFQDRTRMLHRAVLHTVIIEPDHPRVILVWHSSLECHFRVNYLKETTIRIKRRNPMQQIEDSTSFQSGVVV